MFLNTFRSTGARYDMIDDTTMRVYRSRELAPVKFQTNIFPGFPTDLQSPFSILLTQRRVTREFMKLCLNLDLAGLLSLNHSSERQRFSTHIRRSFMVRLNLYEAMLPRGIYVQELL